MHSVWAARGRAAGPAATPAHPRPTTHATQDLSTLDITKLNPLSPEVISRQATINIGGAAAALRSCCMCLHAPARSRACMHARMHAHACARCRA